MSVGYSISYIHAFLTLSELIDGEGMQKNVQWNRPIFNVRPLSQEVKALHLDCQIFLKFRKLNGNSTILITSDCLCC
jgi:hypothetical protein